MRIKKAMNVLETRRLTGRKSGLTQALVAKKTASSTWPDTVFASYYSIPPICLYFRLFSYIR